MYSPPKIVKILLSLLATFGQLNFFIYMTIIKNMNYVLAAEFQWQFKNESEYGMLFFVWLEPNFDLNQPLANIGRTTFLWWVNGLHETEFLAWSFALVNRVGFFALSNEPSIRTTGFTLQSNSLEQNVVKWIFENSR